MSANPHTSTIAMTGCAHTILALVNGQYKAAGVLPLRVDGSGNLQGLMRLKHTKQFKKGASAAYCLHPIGGKRASVDKDAIDTASRHVSTFPAFQSAGPDCRVATYSAIQSRTSVSRVLWHAKSKYALLIYQLPDSHAEAITAQTAAKFTQRAADARSSSSTADLSDAKGRHKAHASRLAELAEQKATAMAAEDFEKCLTLRDEVEKVKLELKTLAAQIAALQASHVR
jgi:hypothetical protein